LTEPNTMPGSGPGPPRGQRTEGTIQIVIMLAIGGAAGAASFTHVHDVALAHGQPDWISWADAIVLELTSVASGLELRRRKRIGKSPAFPAAVLTVGVALSLAAQVVEAEPSIIGWIAAALPAAGFLAMVKIAMGRADPGHLQPVPRPAVIVPAQRQPVPNNLGLVPDSEEPVPAEPGPAATMTGQPRTVRDDSPQIAALLPAARTVAASLAVQGIPLSRTSLATQLRAEGHTLSNATASALVHTLRTEPAPQAATGPEA